MGNEQSSPQTSSGRRQPTGTGVPVSQSSSKQSGIVVVGTKQDPSASDSYLDTYITRLHSCPSFQPILQSSLTADAKPQPGDFVSQLDWRAALKVSNRVQDHLHACAEAVSFDQNSLTTQIKQVDILATRVMQKYTERQKAFAKYAEHTKKIDEISTSLKKVRMNLDQTFSLLDDLNKLLPEEDRIETA